jgi:hypothetical protein
MTSAEESFATAQPSRGSAWAIELAQSSPIPLPTLSRQGRGLGPIKLERESVAHDTANFLAGQLQLHLQLALHLYRSLRIVAGRSCAPQLTCPEQCRLTRLCNHHQAKI